MPDNFQAKPKSILSDENILDNDWVGKATMMFDKRHGRISLVNQSFLSLTGYSLDDVVGCHFSMVFPDYSLTDLLNPHAIHLQLLKQSGDLVLVQTEIVPTVENSDMMLLLISTDGIGLNPQENTAVENRFENILELSKLTNESSLNLAMMKAVNILRNVFHARIVGIYWADNQHPSIRRIAGYDPNNVLPKSLPSGDLVALSKPVVWRKAYQLKAVSLPDSKPTPANFLASVPLGMAGGLVGLVMVGDLVWDPPNGLENLLELVRTNLNNTISHFVLTENLRSEIEQLEKKLRIRDMQIAHQDDVVILLDPDLQILEINDSVEAVLNYSPLELIGKHVEDLLIGEPILLAAFEDAQRGTSQRLGPLMVHDRNGNQVPIIAQIIPMKEAGQNEYIIVIVSDVSAVEQKNLEKQQLEHRALLGEFISAFAHDVRNPINNISTSAQLLKIKVDSEDPNQEIVDRLLEDCDRLTHLMESFLSFSRLVDRSRFEPLDIGMLVMKVLSKWGPRMNSLEIKLFTTIEDPLPMVNADRRSLERVFENLISNAVAAMADKVDNPILSVQIDVMNEVDSKRKQLVVNVSDNGVGIPDDLRERIFDPFVSTKSEGTGLGLAISNQIVTAHQGNITVESFPGGTVFRVYLPIMEV